MSQGKPEGAEESRVGYFLYLSPREMVPFVKIDYDILSSKYSMKSRFYRGTFHGHPDRIVIRFGVKRTDFNYSFFGYRQAYWAIRYSRKFGKKSIVILAGFDVMEEEDPNLKQRMPMVKYILRNADLLLAVSRRVLDRTFEIEKDSRAELLHSGLDSSRFVPGGEKEKMVLTAAYVTRPSLKRKGLEVFVRTASLLPDYEFVMVGGWPDDTIDYLRSIAPRNMTFTGFAKENDLLRYYQRASVYVQASLHECFGFSMAEAMLCGCAPVVSDRGAIPEVVGDAGIYVDPERPEDVARGIRQAMQDEGLGARARERIASRFPLENRRKALLERVERMLG